MGCGYSCPLFTGTTYLDGTLDGPAGQLLEVVRRIRHQIDSRFQHLVRQLAS